MGKFLLAALQQGAGWGIGKPFWPWFWPWLSSASDAPDNGRVITAMQVLMLNSLDRRTVPLLLLAGRQLARPHHTHTQTNTGYKRKPVSVIVVGIYCNSYY